MDSTQVTTLLRAWMSQKSFDDENLAFAVPAHSGCMKHMANVRILVQDAFPCISAGLHPPSRHERLPSPRGALQSFPILPVELTCYGREPCPCKDWQNLHFIFYVKDMPEFAEAWALGERRPARRTLFWCFQFIILRIMITWGLWFRAPEVCPHVPSRSTMIRGMPETNWHSTNLYPRCSSRNSQTHSTTQNCWFWVKISLSLGVPSGPPLPGPSEQPPV